MESQVRSLQKELKEHNKYLNKYGLKVYEVKPDNNCLFRALAHVAKKGGYSHRRLRIMATDHMMSHICDFKTFLCYDTSTTIDAKNEIKELARLDTCAGFETFMALTQVLNIKILVTSGGTTVYGGVKTTASYFGRDPPEETAHIGWLTAGCYYAAIPEKEPDSRISIQKKVLEDKYDDMFTSGRPPSHVCSCDPAAACHGGCSSCQKWHSPYDLADDPIGSETSSSDESPEPYISPDKIFSDVCKFLSQSSGMISNHKWTDVLESLGLSYGEVKSLGQNRSYDTDQEKIKEGLMQWWNSAGDGKRNLATIERALKDNKLNGTRGDLHREFADKWL